MLRGSIKSWLYCFNSQSFQHTITSGFTIENLTATKLDEWIFALLTYYHGTAMWFKNSLGLPISSQMFVEVTACLDSVFYTPVEIEDTGTQVPRNTLIFKL